jgi:ribokinase
MPKYVTAGGMRIDYLITHDGQAHIDLVGGNALYSAVGAAIWSEDVGIWSKIGENYPAEQLRTVTGYGIQTYGLKRVPGYHDHRTFYAYTPEGRRHDTQPAQHFGRIGMSMPAALDGYEDSTPNQDNPHVLEPLAVYAGDWPDQYDSSEYVHLAPLPISSHLAITQFLDAGGNHVLTVDPGERYMIPDLRAYIKQMLPFIRVFLPSDQEVRSLFGSDVSIVEAAEIFGEWGVENVIIKSGARGVLVYERNGNRKTLIPAFHKPGDSRVTDITGAGDSFCGGFLFGMKQTSDPVQASYYGLISASLTIEGYGALFALEHGREKAHDRLQEIMSR